MDSNRATPERLHEFLYPKSIALVGASDNSFWSLNTFNNLKDINFQGSIYCVNPKREVVHGQKAYRSLLDIESHVDLAYVMVSTNRVMDVLKEAAAKNIRNLVLLTGGFSEAGKEGIEREKEVLGFALQHDLLILGPNGLGFINIPGRVSVYSTRGATSDKVGNIGFVLQSGQMADGILTMAKSQNIALSFLISIGNELMVSSTDVMDYLIEDESTHVIGVFLESIKHPEEFIRVARKALKYGKPIVAFKIGRSEESAKAAMAHTGALVGDDVLNNAVFRQLGVIRVNSLEDLLTTTSTLSYIPELKGRRMGVVSLSGGACAVLSDRAKDEQILLPQFQAETVEQLKKIVPEFSTVFNPLDVTGYVVVDPTLQARALEIVAEDPNLDFIVCIPGKWPEEAGIESKGAYERFSNLSFAIDKSKIPIVPMMEIAVEVPPSGIIMSERFNLHFVAGMEHGMTAIGNAVWWNEKYAEFMEREFNRSDRLIEKITKDVKLEIVETEEEWTESVAREFLNNNGIPVVPGIMATNETEVLAASEKIGFPVVIKVQSKDIPHKSDVGGVVLGLETAEEVMKAYHLMMNNLGKHASTSRVDGVLVSPMRPEGIELLVGIVKDPLWGFVLAVGFGGIFVEVLKDTSLRILPIDQSEIKLMLNELRGSSLFKGLRGREATDLNQLSEVIYKITEIAMSKAENLSVLEVNPLWVKGVEIEALDALIIWN